MGGYPLGTETARMGPLLSRLARRADEAGFDSLWTMDHFFQIPITGQPPEAPLLEAYAILAFLAAETERIGLGIPFPPLAERFERLEEVVQIALQMWRGDQAPWQGTHYQLLRPLNSPNTLQHPHPPILIAGSGERKTLRLVARYGDMCNLFDLPGAGFADDLKHKLDVLRSHCADAGRDYGAIEKTVSTFVDPYDDRTRVVDHLAELAGLGISHAIVSPKGPWDEASLDRVAAIVPDVHAIAPN